MRAFEFRLDPVLKVQERRKRLAEFRRHEALGALRRQESAVTHLQRQIADLAADEPASWPASSARAQWLGRELKLAEEGVRRARNAVTLASEHLKKTTIAVEVLLELKRQGLQRYRDGVAAQEQQRVEEFVLRRWNEQRRADEIDLTEDLT